MNAAQRLAERLLRIEAALARITKRQQRDAIRKQRLLRAATEIRCGLTDDTLHAYQSLKQMERTAGVRRG